ncbi:M20 metallopeptidase family protein [Enterococcus rivorum]|uniref:Peptidase M20 n=1 Tax=Enterococcus rivorum TaxID=762845 RepID=A0A1E5L1I9_9ENTE|nr:amidohydrolase [Enterococcus rivorum]MBP2097730.1 amidohydrolase [Enterococcus rivorum]OEH83998.1 peptidase M20 [Enterococcus rivorum]
MSIVELMPQQDMIVWRRHLHEHPELSFHEVETAKYIRGILDTFPNLEISSLTENSVIATLKGSKPGKTVALRADIDALPIIEESDVTFPSKNHGVMHACGHDTHTAMLLGAIKVLAEMQDKIAGTVKFIFQPAEEEPPGGAKLLVEAGVMDDVDEVFGLHIAPNVPVGVIGIRKGALTAASDVVTLNIHGKGSHGSTPDLSIDPILVGVEIISNLNNIVSRNISPFDNVVISIGEFNSGKTSNVIPNDARIQATVRTNDPEVRKYVKKRIEEIIKGVCEMYGATYELDYLLGYSPVINDSAATDLVIQAANKVVGVNHVVEPPIMMGSEDFSAYTDVKPGSFFILGGGTAAEGCGYMNHHPKFKINEDCLVYGAAMHTQIVLDCLNVE